MIDGGYATRSKHGVAVGSRREGWPHVFTFAGNHELMFDVCRSSEAAECGLGRDGILPHKWQ